METCFECCAKGEGWFSSDETKWINHIKKLKEKYPDKVKIVRQPEDNDGCIYCRIPSDWMKIKPKRECTLTEDQRAAIHESLMAGKAAKLQNKSNDD